MKASNIHGANVCRKAPGDPGEVSGRPAASTCLQSTREIQPVNNYVSSKAITAMLKIPVSAKEV